MRNNGTAAAVPRAASPYRLARRADEKPATVVEAGMLHIAGEPVVIAGPCSAESQEQILTTAGLVRSAGATLL